MKRVLLAILSAAISVGSVCAQEGAKDLTGNWQGTLEAGNGLRTLLKITNNDGKYKAVMYSIDQGGQPIAVNTISIQGNAVTFGITMLDLKYAGMLSPDGNTISGSVTQHGETHALNLTHVSDENAWAVPEPPKPMAKDAKPKFDVVTVKPSDPNRQGQGFTIRGRHVMTMSTTVDDLITFAYGLQVKEIVDGPGWFETDKFDVDGVPDVEGQPSVQQMKYLMQDVLATRFNLKFHKDTRVLAVYVLTVAKGGPKMTLSTAGPDDLIGFGFRKLGDLAVHNNTMKDFCNGMQGVVMDKPVVDHTGLTDRYDFNLRWTPDDSQFVQFGPRAAPKESDDPNAPPSLYTALQEQLGLKLEATKAAADVVVIDHVEKPSAN